MPETCLYVFNPDEWDRKYRRSSSVEGVWKCPHEAFSDRDYCLFHLPPEERKKVGVSPEVVRDEFMNAVASEDKSKNKFIGGRFRELDLEHQDVETAGRYPVDMRHTVIEGQVNLSDAYFDMPVFMDHSVFESQLEAIGTEFGSACSFVDVTFDRINFDGAIFNNEVDFHDAVFEETVDFTDILVERNMDFHNAVFEKNVDFRLSEFNGNVNFKNASFRGESDFIESVFKLEANFADATFGENTVFRYTEFRDSAIFRNTTFNGNVNFRKASFDSETDFRHSNFSRWVVFHNTTFQGRSDFEGAVFVGDTDFTETEFFQDVNLSNTTFRSKVSLEVEPMEDEVMVDMEGSDLSRGYIREPENGRVFYDLSHGTLGDVDLRKPQSWREDENLLDYFLLYDTEYEGFDFREHRDDLSKRKWRIHTAEIGDRELEPHFLMNTYQYATRAAREVRDRKIANKFYIRYKKYKRQVHRRDMLESDSVATRVRGVGRWLGNFVLDITVGYGKKPWRVLPILVVIGLIAAYMMNLI
ncbi:MAG: pentapeptide repeat-containing protein [Halobacteria archaeon]|nr:pentapeptide repeat-containing protein [Halobacteria archaeon]